MTPEQQGAAERAARTAIKRRKARGSDADDIHQDALLIALECIADGVVEPSHIYQWVRSTLRHRDEPPHANLGYATNSVPDTLTETDRYREELAQLLDTVDLTPREREAVRLLHIEKLTDVDAASQMGIGIDTFRVRAASARRKLHEYVKSHVNG